MPKSKRKLKEERDARSQRIQAVYSEFLQSDSDDYSDDEGFRLFTYCRKCKVCKQWQKRLLQHLNKSLECGKGYNETELLDLKEELKSFQKYKTSERKKANYQHNKQNLAQKYQENKANIFKKYAENKSMYQERKRKSYHENKEKYVPTREKYYQENKEKIKNKYEVQKKTFLEQNWLMEHNEHREFRLSLLTKLEENVRAKNNTENRFMTSTRIRHIEKLMPKCQSTKTKEELDELGKTIIDKFNAFETKIDLIMKGTKDMEAINFQSNDDWKVFTDMCSKLEEDLDKLRCSHSRKDAPKDQKISTEWKELQLLIDDQLKTISDELNEPLSYSTKCNSTLHHEKPVWYGLCYCQKLDPAEVKKHDELAKAMENKFL